MDKQKAIIKLEEKQQQLEKVQSEPKQSVKKEEKKEEQPKQPAVQVPANARWYVVHTYSGHENKVAANLKQRIETMKLSGKIFDIIVPTRNIVTVKHGKKEEQKEKIFPGYILVKMVLGDDTWLAVRTTQGVTAFVGAGNKPTPISDSEVATILKFMAQEAPKYKTSFSMGEAVKIVDGPFSDFLGTIDTIDEEKGKLKVLVSIFGRETPVELDFLQVAKL
jgi:transcriptional antiterminator NusG